MDRDNSERMMHAFYLSRNRFAMTFVEPMLLFHKVLPTYLAEDGRHDLPNTSVIR